MTSERPFPQIALDSVVFQYGKNTGIPRLWRSLLQVWSEQGFTQHLLIIDRNNTAPRLPGVRYCAMPLYDYGSTGADAQQLQAICDAEGIDLFISTYYTTPISTPSVFMAYDMIPEVMAANLNENIWREKHYAILHACQYICISQSTARDLVQFFPHNIAKADVAIAYCGVNSVFAPASDADVQAFRAAYSLEQPYFLVVGERLGVGGYKNVPLLFRALARGGDRQPVAVVCVGGQPELEPELLELAGDVPVQCLTLSDEELRVAYGGAIALVYPSRYEGFGLPVAEAMACGCPVITSAVSSLPEVGGDAVLYVNPDSAADLANGLLAVQQPDTRQMLIEKGLVQARAFTWEQAAEQVAQVLKQTASELKAAQQAEQPVRDAAFWHYFRTLQQDYQPLEVALAQSQRQLAQAERQLRRSQNQVQQLQQRLTAARERIQGMESTRVWRIRSALVELKQKLRLTPMS